ncbi:MAG: hypothetical protein JWP44_4107, partial [Mucilaginibacter sp.]|nr:hypothetical protein [Mucilaginibacter sp.]
PGFKNIPLCYFIGETDEWPPNKDGQPWSRDFIWPVIRQSALALRTADNNNLTGVVTDAGGGHLDWSDRLSKFMALYIDKACVYRLPKKIPLKGFIKLNLMRPESGWLTDARGLDPDHFKPAPYKKYKGDPKKAYWFFDKETALAAMAFAGDRAIRQKQMLTFVQHDTLLPISKQGFVNLSFLPEADGMTFNVQGGFLPAIPQKFIGGGKPIGHANGAIQFRLITGPAIQTGPDQFRIAFNRSASGGDIWIQEEHPGDAVYRHAVQPAQMKLPAKLTTGTPQTITFPKIADQRAGVQQIDLSATTNTGLPVGYYVVSGPAVVSGHVLKFTQIPVKSKYPVKVTLTAYQWGRMNEPLYQSAEPVTQSFFLYK